MQLDGLVGVERAQKRKIYQSFVWTQTSIMATSGSSSTHTPPAISRFFIFNPKFGPREDNDHEKILFYHPESTSLDAKMKDVGLGEALTNVTKYVIIDKNKPISEIQA